MLFLYENELGNLSIAYLQNSRKVAKTNICRKQRKHDVNLSQSFHMCIREIIHSVTVQSRAKMSNITVLPSGSD